MSPSSRVTRSLRTPMLGFLALALLFFAVIGVGLVTQFRPTVRVLADDGTAARRAFASRSALWSAIKLEQDLLVQFYFLARRAPQPADSVAAWRDRIEQRVLQVEFFEPLSRSASSSSNAVRLVGRADASVSQLLSQMLGVVAAIEVGDIALGEALLRASDAELEPLSAVLDSITLVTLDQFGTRSALLDESVGRATRWLAIWGVIGAAMVVMISLWMRKRLLRPLAQLDAGLARIEAGELDITLPVERDDELGRVARQLNKTALTLRERREDEARHAALQSAARTRAIFDSALDPVIVFDERGAIREWNPQAHTVFGWTREQALGSRYAELLQPLDQTGSLPVRFESLLAQSTPAELRLVRRDGTRHPVEVSVVPLVGSGEQEYAAFLHDVSEQRTLEQTLRQAQKMEAIGQLAGGVAHDFNNLLAAIIGYAELMQHRADVPGDLRSDAAAIRTTALRGKDLTRSLLTFSRRTPAREEPFDLLTVLEETVALVDRTFDRRIVVSLHNELDSAPMRGDASILSNALLNLAVNARDVMPDGGRLEFTLRRSLLSNVANDRCVELLVRDTGGGMAPEVKARLFEPFFTTKELGKGTGLGLALVYAAVTAHHGTIGVESELGAGTTFTLCLPLSEEVVRESPEVAAAQRRTEGRVMLVDDEQPVRAVAARLLKRIGYEVDEASHGEAAVAALRENAKGIDLVLIDGNMPRMSGLEAAEIIHAEHPHLPLVLVTGRPGNESVDALRERGIMEVLEKPYSLAQLVAVTSRWISNVA